MKTAAETMEIFDSFPRPVREAISSSLLDWSAGIETVQSFHRVHGTAATVAAIRKTNSKLRKEYLERIA